MGQLGRLGEPNRQFHALSFRELNRLGFANRLFHQLRSWLLVQCVRAA